MRPSAPSAAHAPDQMTTLDRIAACGAGVAEAYRRLLRQNAARRERTADEGAASQGTADGCSVSVALLSGTVLRGGAAQPSVLDAVRQPLEAALHAGVRLRILRASVRGSCALLVAERQGAPLAPLDGSDDAVREPRLCALVRREAHGGWRTVAYAFDGAGEPWTRWPARFGVAVAFLPGPGAYPPA